MKKIIIVAHGCSRSGVGDPDVKTITKATEDLSFSTAKSYMDGENFPEYASASMSEFQPLSDSDCLFFFGFVPHGTGIVNTGMRRGGHIHGEEIFVLRNANASLPEIGLFARRNDAKVIMLACRSYI